MDRKNENMPTGHNFRGAEKNAATNLITKKKIWSQRAMTRIKQIEKRQRLRLISLYKNMK